MNLIYSMIKCDLCGYSIEYTKTNNKWFEKGTGKEVTPWKPRSLTVVFMTDQNDGTSCKPYLSNEVMDICPECLEKLTKMYPIVGYGAQGYNTFKFREET